MPIVLGIESTAHTFGIGIVKDGKVLSNCKRVFTTEKGGMIPIEVAKFHCNNKNEIYFEALDKVGMTPRAYPEYPKGHEKSSRKISTRGKEDEIDAIAFSQGPGLAPCLLEGMKFAKELSERLKKPIVPVNHCVAHLEIGRLTGASDPVMLYASGANTQVIAYASGKYRVFGETLDLGVGNFIDTFGRYAGIGFPAGPAIQKLAETSETPRAYPEYPKGHEKSSRKISTRGNYIELPYKVKGMDISLSGILTNLKQKLEKGAHGRTPKNIQKNIFTKGNLAYSLQETVFAMLVETAERALAHTGKKELLLGGGVACNTRLQEMCKIMCDERIEKTKLFVPETSLLVDNAGMIAYLGEIMFKKKIYEKNLDKVDIMPRQRTDDVNVEWKD